MEAGKGKGGGRRERKQRTRLWPVYVLLLAICGLLIAVVVALHRSAAPPVALPEINYESRSAQGAATALHEAERPREPLEGEAQRAPSRDTERAPAALVRPAVRGTLFFVIDDVGNNVDELRPFLAFPGPLTLSILPQLASTKSSYDLIVADGKMPILHLPMQAIGGVFPGPGAIYVGMSERAVDSTIAKDLEGLDRITWVNNHEGSRVTSDETTMGYVLSFLRERNLAFLDSVTTADSAVQAVAERLAMPYYKRNSLFLDNDVQDGKIVAMIDSGLAVAQRDGFAVMIGHVWDAQLASLLIDLYPKLKAEGYAFADLAALPDVEAQRVRAGN